MEYINIGGAVAAALNVLMLSLVLLLIRITMRFMDKHVDNNRTGAIEATPPLPNIEELIERSVARTEDRIRKRYERSIQKIDGIDPNLVPDLESQDPVLADFHRVARGGE